METNKVDISIPTRVAVQKLSDTNLIRVLKTGEVPGLVERFVPREAIVQMIRDNVCEEVGQESHKKGYVMSLKNDEDVYFIEGRQE